MSNVQQHDYYDILQVRRNASPQEIERAYRTISGRYAFQRHEQQSFLEDREDVITQLEEAYKTLSDREKRDAYDRGVFGMSSNLAAVNPYAGPRSPVTHSGSAKGRKTRHNVYEDYYGFSEKPFDLTPDPKYLYLSPKHKEVLAHLVFGLQENNGFLKIIGEVGTGKTMISRAFLNQLHQDFNIAYIFNPCLDSVELLQSINLELGIPAKSTSRKQLTDILNEFLLEERKKGHRVVVIIDEAQDLDAGVLEQLRLLSNLETETQKLIQIVLIGQPELNSLLDRDELRQLRQRITIQWELLPLNLEETRGYIQHRLNIALGRGKVQFTRSAVDLVYKNSQGIPRMINVLADRALLIGYTMNTKKIGSKVIRLAVKDVGGICLPPSRFQSFWSTALPVMGLLGLFGIALNYVSIPDFSSSPSPVNNIKQYIEENPLDVQPSPALTQTPPQISKSLPLEPLHVKQSTIIKDPKPVLENPMAASESGSLEITQTEKLITYLSSLSFSESKIEAARWVLESWGLIPENSIGIGESVFETLERDYQLSIHEMSGRLQRLISLNYPAVLEMTLPNSQGTKYLALISIKRDMGVFGSVDQIEMPLSTLDQLWNGRALVFWRDFERLPQRMAKGFKGKEALWVQKNLRLLGFFKGREAPVYGPKTLKAVVRFQRKHGIKDDGSLNTQSRMTLYNLLNIYHTPRLVSE